MTPLITEGEPDRPRKYYSYLLRLWNEGSEISWHIYLQDVNTGIQLKFTSLESLVVYLQAQIDAEQPG
ncbi:MAG: hypothetical protein WAM60_17200 [Candidatus Promineifilaceae bacterium]